MTDFTGTQLATILSALDGQTRKPASKAVAFAAIRRHADERGCTVDDILEAAAGLLDGRMGADDFRAALRDDGAADEPGDDATTDLAEAEEDAPVAATVALAGELDEIGGDDEADDAGEVAEPETAAVHINDLHASDDPIAIANAASWPTPMTLRQQLLAACEAAEHWLQAELDRPGETRPDDILRTLRAAIDRARQQPSRAATGEQPNGPKTPRADTKQARLIEMLRKGASISEMASELGWLRHTCHGALAGLKKKRGLEIVSDKHAGGERVYHIVSA
ncbi:MAG: DUF3489 domain-containing protein [Rhodospirillales bacterium]|nr:DUF3489 domain-containing protein [Rhodospirillales bacterium]